MAMSENTFVIKALLEIPPLSPVEKPLLSETSDAPNDQQEKNCLSVPSAMTASAASDAMLEN